MKKTVRSNLITIGMVVAAYIIVQILIGTGNISNLMQGLLVPLCMYAILAVSLNLTVGVLGELSLGHAGFMCVGAFSSAFFSKCMQIFVPSMPTGVRFFIAILIGAAMAGLFGFLIGIPVLRLKGDYLAIVTLAFGEIIKNLLNVFYLGIDENGIHFATKNSMNLHMEDTDKIIIEGAQGIKRIPSDANFTVSVILLLITLIIVLNLIHSRDGRAIMAIRDNTIAAESVGIPITKYKLMVFSISAAFAGVAGVLYAHNFSPLKASNFGYNTSIMILVYVVLGGMGNIRGSVIASVVLYTLPELLRGVVRDSRMLIYAIVLIIIMLFNWAPKCLEWREKVAAMVKIKFGKKNTSKEVQ